MRGRGWQAWFVLGMGMSLSAACSSGDANVRAPGDQSPRAQPRTGAAGADIPGGTSPAAVATGGSDGNSSSPTPAATSNTGAGVKPRPDLDPQAQFDWPEAEPGQAKCQAGTYVGTFGCSLFVDPTMPPPDGTPPDFGGPITLEFKESADGEFLELVNAKLDGSANDALGFTADLNGRLDCSTLEFSATISNGVYGLGSPILLPTGDVNGTVSGKLDLQTGQLNGTWSLFSSVAPDTACDGPWAAALVP